LRIAPSIPKEALEALRKTMQDSNSDVADAARRAVSLHTSPSPFPRSVQSELFLCHSENRLFLEGQSDHVRFSDEDFSDSYPIMSTIFSITPMLIPGICFWQYRLTPHIALLIIGLIFLSFSLFVIWKTIIYNILRNRFLREGQLILGEVVSCGTTWEIGEESADYWEVTLEYAFSNPAGQRMTTHTNFQKADGWHTPRRGISVAVFYADDTNYRLL
jgi:hypothetical protein